MLRLTGFSDAQTMTAGRWKTCSVMKDYIDWEVDLALRVRGARLASHASHKAHTYVGTVLSTQPGAGRANVVHK